MTGTVIAILTASAAQAPTQSVPTTQLEAGRGIIVGDRYYSSEGTFSETLEGKGNSDWEVTLIKALGEPTHLKKPWKKIKSSLC